MQPINVIFPLPEDNIARVLERMKGGVPLTTEIYNREQTQLLAAGELTSLDNQIDPATGTLRLKALLPNDDMRLFPNQFVNVRLLIDLVPGAVVIPAAGVRAGERGVIEGSERLRNGAQVGVKDADDPAKPRQQKEQAKDAAGPDKPRRQKEQRQ
jgi:multidrug efflux pump subunit AcrA (membrane-fusion protein)